MVPYKHLSVLVMPTDYCNMNCVYCFNFRRTIRDKKVMSAETLRHLFSITIPYYDEVKFIWHGGEPLSMGLDFYKMVVALQTEFNTTGTQIINSIQSNLTLMDDAFAQFLIENGFKVGGSFDGTTNHLTRHNSAQILAGREILLKHGGQAGFICVVQSKNIDHLIEDYEWFKANHIGFNLNPYLSSPTQTDDELFVPAEQYIDRVCALFDYWAADASCDIGLSTFEDLVEYILFKAKKLCCYNSCLGKYVGVLYDGTIYNCNRDFPADYAYGNIHDYEDIHNCFESEGFQRMLHAAIARRDHCKKHCELFDFCAGGCSNTAYVGGNMERGNPYFCQITTAIYRHVEAAVAELLKQSELDTPALNPYLIKQFEAFKTKGGAIHGIV